MSTSNLRSLGLLTLTLALSACSQEGLPERSSPTPAPIEASIAEDAVIDAVSLEPTWFEPTSGTVFRLRGGLVSAVQDRVFPTPVRLRVLRDDTIVLLYENELLVQPAIGDAYSVPATTNEFAFDGLTVDDVWFVIWRLGSDSRYELCHALPTGADCVTEVPNMGGYSPVLGVAADRTVYVTDRDVGLYHWAGDALRPVVGASDEPGGDFIVELRASDEGMLGLAYQGVFAIEGDTMRRIWDEYVTDAVGSPDDFVVLSYASGSEQVDPDCRNGWLRTCEMRITWSQYVVTRVRNGATSEIGHESCDFDAPATTEGCARTTWSLGLDADDVVLMGPPLRTLAR